MENPYHVKNSLADARQQQRTYLRDIHFTERHTFYESRLTCYYM